MHLSTPLYVLITGLAIVMPEPFPWTKVCLFVVAIVVVAVTGG